MAMTPQQRSEAARKAAASRRANRVNGTNGYTGNTYTRPTSQPGSTYTARPTSQQTVNSYKAPQATYRGLKLVALSALEDAFVMKLREQGITDEAREAFAKYQKLKALAIGAGATTAEADTALRMATVHLVKLAF